MTRSRLLYVIAVAFLVGCGSLSTKMRSSVPVDVQEFIAGDLFNIMRSQINPVQVPIFIAPVNQGEKKLEMLLRRHGYEVHANARSDDTLVAAMRLSIYHEKSAQTDAGKSYIGTLTIGSVRRLTRLYQHNESGVAPVGVTMVGE